MNDKCISLNYNYTKLIILIIREIMQNYFLLECSFYHFYRLSIELNTVVCIQNILNEFIIWKWEVPLRIILSMFVGFILSIIYQSNLLKTKIWNDLKFGLTSQVIKDRKLLVVQTQWKCALQSYDMASF